MAKIIKQIQLSTNTVVSSKQAARREIANVMANYRFSDMLRELSEAKNSSSISLAIGKHKELLKKYIQLIDEDEEIQELQF